MLPSETSALVGLSGWIAKADVVVVAIFGTGVRGGVVNEPYATAISLVNGSKGAKVAVDLPSGIDPATGAISRPTVRADVTVALHLPKVGLKERAEFTGEVVVRADRHKVRLERERRGAMKVFQIPVGPMQNFAYLVEDERSREAIVIDSGLGDRAYREARIRAGDAQSSTSARRTGTTTT